MSALELKGSILEMVSNLNDLDLLLKIKDLLSDFTTQSVNQDEMYDLLTKAQKEELELSIKESFNEANLTNEEEVFAKLENWKEK